MAGLTGDVTDLGFEVTDLGEDVDVIDGEVAVILAGQVIQDERILELETEAEGESVMSKIPFGNGENFFQLNCLHKFALLHLPTCASYSSLAE